MFGSDRSRYDKFVIAVGTVSVGCFLLFIVWELSAINASYIRGADHAAREYAESAETRISRTCTDREILAFTKCVREEVKAEQESQTAQYDLAEQRRMALWALCSLIVSSVSLIITIVGIYFVWKSLGAAYDAIKSERETGEAQVRAYVQIVSGSLALMPADPSMTDQRVRPVITFSVKNYGQSPARWFRSSFICRFYPPMHSEFRGSLSFPSETWGRDIGVGETETIITNLGSAPLTAEDMRTLADEELHIDLVVRYVFVDVFGTPIEDERVFTTFIPKNGMGVAVSLLRHPASRTQIEELARLSKSMNAQDAGNGRGAGE